MASEKTYHTIVILFAVASLVFLVIPLTSTLVVQEVQKLEIQLKVDNYLGFNVDTDKIYFGVIPPGNIGARKVEIENNEHEKSVVRLKVFGELKGWVVVSENNFALKKGESKTVKVEVYVPEGAELKDYDSKLIIIFTRF